MAATDAHNNIALGFSAQTPRFQTLGIHPNSLTRVPSLSTPNLAPGSYDQLPYSEFSKRNVQRRAQGPNWQQGLYNEQMAKIPHSSFKETYEKHKENQRRLGPGTYPFNDFLAEAEQRPRCVRGALDQLSPRFVKDLPDRAPPPGSYGIPDEKIVEARWQHSSKVPSFEWRQGPRTLPLEGSKLGPGTYNMKSSVEELLSKRVSEKGPYQVFSLDRSAPIKTGHYASIDTWDLSPDFPSKDFPDSVSFVRQLEKNKNGTFSKLTRFPTKPSDRITIEFPGLEPKNVDFPGPGAYEASRSWDPTDFHQKKVPFNSTSTRNDRFAFSNAGSLHSVGVGRFNLLAPVRDETIADKRKRPKRRNIGFASTTTNRFGATDDNILLNERLQPQNLRSEQRTQLYLTGHV